MSAHGDAFAAASLIGCFVIPAVGGVYRLIVGHATDLYQGEIIDWWIASMVVIYIVTYLISDYRSR